MGIGTSLFVMVVGAILTFAVEVELEAFDLDAAGIVLMLTGALGLVLSLVLWDSWWGGWSPSSRRNRP